MIDPHLQLDVRSSEGCKLVSYRDTENVLTIGWGHELRDQSQQAGALVWTQAQADEQLQADLIAAGVYAKALPEWAALDSICRQNAVIELCFEMRSRWLPFKDTRACILAKDWKGAHDNLLNSRWANEVHTARANRIADYLLTGEYP
jgi:GH24 family phage-related lysozyme (muramidase)